eukprot:789069_1
MALFLLILSILSTLTTSQKNPHIVYILIDDWGWANVEFHNNRQKTPNIASLLPQSLYLNDFYAYKFCSPTRTSFMTGRLPYHVNEENGPVCSKGFGIPINMTTISERLVSDAGYEAHQIGKWHMGMSSMQHAPFGKLFTTSLGYFHAGEDHYTQYAEDDNCTGVDLWDTDRPGYKYNGTYGGYLYSNRAQEIIDNYDINNGKPLFMYLATQNCHAPLEVPQPYIDKFPSNWDSQQRTYAAMSNFADEIIGNVTDALKKRKMWNDTLLFITSDNGGNGHANNSPLRGGKFSNFQGGVRVIGMVSGGYLPSKRRGISVNGTFHIADVYSTLCAIVGIDPSDKRAKKAGLPPIDSINMWPFMTGETSISPRTEFVLASLDIRGGGGGLISGDWKILFGQQSPAYWTTLDSPNGTTPEPANISCGDLSNGGCLFNIKLDPSEHFDVINESENAAIVKQLRDKYITLLNTTYTPDTGGKDKKCCKQIQKNGGYWGPWLNYTKPTN